MKKLLLSIGVFTSITIFAQNNVGIGTSTPDASAVLDVTATDKGVLIPRVALVQTTSAAPITAPATSLLVYNTATINDVVPGYYYWDGSVWVPLISSSGGNNWSLLGNAGTNSTTNFLGTTDVQDLVLKTNNTERALFLSTGGIRYNLSGADLGGPGFNVMQVDAGGDDDGFVGYSVTGQAIEAWSSGTTSTALIGVGQNSGGFLLTNGSGGAVTGVSTGLYARTTGSLTTQCIIGQDNYSAQWLMGYWDNTTFQYFKIQGTGAVSTIVKDLNEKNVTMFCVEAPENFFQDIGHTKLVNGRVHVDIDPILSKNIIVNEEHPLKVFVQLEGDCNGVYVANKTATGFDIIELQNGTSNVELTYTIYATRGDEKYINQTTGEIRIAKYDKRFPLAPSYKTSIKENNPK